MTRVPGCKSLTNRLFGLAMAAALSLGVQACKAKPSEEACKDAIENMRSIYGQDSNEMGADPIAAIRSCRAQSSKETVECMRTARTPADLAKCEGSELIKKGDEAAKPAEEVPAAPVEETKPEAPVVPDANPGTAVAPVPPTETAPPTEAAPPAEAEKPAAEKPAAEKPAAEKPAAEKPAAEKPAAVKPAAEKPAAETTAAP